MHGVNACALGSVAVLMMYAYGGWGEGSLVEISAACRNELPQAKRARLSPDALADLRARCEPEGGRHKDVIKAYADFCESNSAEIGQLSGIGELKDTTIGRMYLSDIGMKAYLMSLVDGRKAANLARLFTDLKKGLRSLNLPAAVFPAWADQGVRAPPAV